MTVLYFGEKWDSPMLDEDARQVRTPRRKPCYWCTDKIRRRDRGVLRPVGRLGDNGKMVGSLEAIHAECDLRSIVGSPAHFKGLCSCKGFEEPVWPGTKHEESLEVLRLVNEERENAGFGRLW